MSKVLIHCEAHCQKYENLNNYNSKTIKDILKIPTNLSSVSGTKKFANTKDKNALSEKCDPNIQICRTDKAIF